MVNAYIRPLFSARIFQLCETEMLQFAIAFTKYPRRVDQ